MPMIPRCRKEATSAATSAVAMRCFTILLKDFVDLYKAVSVGIQTEKPVITNYTNERWNVVLQNVEGSQCSGY